MLCICVCVCVWVCIYMPLIDALFWCALVCCCPLLHATAFFALLGLICLARHFIFTVYKLTKLFCCLVDAVVVKWFSCCFMITATLRLRNKMAATNNWPGLVANLYAAAIRMCCAYAMWAAHLTEIVFAFFVGFFKAKSKQAQARTHTHTHTHTYLEEKTFAFGFALISTGSVFQFHAVDCGRWALVKKANLRLLPTKSCPMDISSSLLTLRKQMQIS